MPPALVDQADAAATFIAIDALRDEQNFRSGFEGVHDGEYPSTCCPCCMSSLYSGTHPASSAAATIMLSQ